VLALLLAAALSADPTPKGLTLTGVVRDKAGRPVPNATVFVRTAAPRRGVGVL
jgi:protocatechuate 3,4-dioxygenase beta subunit